MSCRVLAADAASGPTPQKSSFRRSRRPQVLELKIHLDSDDVVRLPDDPYLFPYSEYGECATYKIEDTITGVVALTAPPDCQVWITQLLLTFEQFAQFNRSVEGYQLAYVCRAELPRPGRGRSVETEVAAAGTRIVRGDTSRRRRGLRRGCIPSRPPPRASGTASASSEAPRTVCSWRAPSRCRFPST